MKKKILITGASGFIGSFFVEEALRQDYEVYAGIRRTSSREFLQQEGLQFFEMDLSSSEVLHVQLKEHAQAYGPFDHVIHNAGSTGTKGSADFLTINYHGTKHLVDALVAQGMPTGKFLYVSSLAACGPGDPTTFEPIRLDGNKGPVSEYGRSKLLAERYIKSIPGFPYLIVKPTAVYGPRDRDILQFFKLINRGIEPYMGRHRQMISMIYVKDLARTVMRLLDSPSVKAAYIVSDGFDYDKEQLGSMIRSLLKKKTLKFKIPMTPLRALIGGSEKVHQFFGRQPFLNLEKLNEISESNWLCDSRAVWKELSLAPEYNLETGLKETTDWYKMNGWLN